ncbi:MULTISPECIES: phosphopantetheine-binding protein [unclassified Mycoplasma]|uniref:phosphopantetheine-binding protein n=2 Tax=Mycoplasma TaxID=2093 RepID=UPI002810FA25|nr:MULTISPECIES: phosphopantetheine-binding protein [unclassified Mycoplasma]
MSLDYEKWIMSQIERLSKKKVNYDAYIKDINIDSLDLAEVIINLEEKYGIVISDEEILNIEKVKDVLELVSKKVGEK